MEVTAKWGRESSSSPEVFSGRKKDSKRFRGPHKEILKRFCEPHHVTSSIGKFFFPRCCISNWWNWQRNKCTEKNTSITDSFCLQRELELWNFSRYILVKLVVMLHVDPWENTRRKRNEDKKNKEKKNNFHLYCLNGEGNKEMKYIIFFIFDLLCFAMVVFFLYVKKR